jgi:hypothetical protein
MHGKTRSFNYDIRPRPTIKSDYPKTWWVYYGGVVVGLITLGILCMYSRLVLFVRSNHIAVHTKIYWVRFKRFVGLKRRC